MYEKMLDVGGKVIQKTIVRKSDSAWIPCDPMNKDYQEYLAWQKKDGNAKTIDELPTKE